MINLFKTLNENPDRYDDFQEVKPKAFEQIAEVYFNLCSLVDTCVRQSNTKDTSIQLDRVIDTLRHTNYFNDYYEIDDNTYDVLYIDREVNHGELDECTLTLSVKDNKLYVSNCIEIGIKGEDYPMEVFIDDVIFTIQTLDKK